jgi:hypothetical protein
MVTKERSHVASSEANHASVSRKRRQLRRPPAPRAIW